MKDLEEQNALKKEAWKHSQGQIDYDEHRLDELEDPGVQYFDTHVVNYARILKSFAELGSSTAGPDATALTQEPSHAMFYEKYLRGMYWWQPNNDLTDAIMPPGYIENMTEDDKEAFKPMLEAIQEDNAIRGKAQRLYDKIFAPTVEKYIEKFHPDPANLAKDAAGTTELFDDWSIPYEKRHNQVKFNNRIHTQMDFNVQEDF